jgi:hypothetical protein
MLFFRETRVSIFASLIALVFTNINVILFKNFTFARRLYLRSLRFLRSLRSLRFLRVVLRSLRSLRVTLRRPPLPVTRRLMALLLLVPRLFIILLLPFPIDLQTPSPVFSVVLPAFSTKPSAELTGPVIRLIIFDDILL